MNLKELKQHYDKGYITLNYKEFKCARENMKVGDIFIGNTKNKVIIISIVTTLFHGHLQSFRLYNFDTFTLYYTQNYNEFERKELLTTYRKDK